MEINVRGDRRIVEVWLTNPEKQDELARKRLEDLCQRYGKKKYYVAVFLSGEQDLAEETSALLRRNRKRLAEREVRKKRAGTPKGAAGGAAVR